MSENKNNIIIVKIPKIKNNKKVKIDKVSVELVLEDVKIADTAVVNDTVKVVDTAVVPEKPIKYYESKNLKTGKVYLKKQYYNSTYHKEKYLANKEKYKLNNENRKNRIKKAKELLKDMNIDFLKL